MCDQRIEQTCQQAMMNHQANGRRMHRLSLVMVTTLAAVLSVVLSLAACGAGSPSPSPTPTLHSGIQGRTMITGGPKGRRPDPGTPVTVVAAGPNSRIVAKVTSDASGVFRVDLLPGDYVLIDDPNPAPASVWPTPSPTGEPVPVRAAAKLVRVEGGAYAKVTLLVHLLGP